MKAFSRSRCALQYPSAGSLFNDRQFSWWWLWCLSCVWNWSAMWVIWCLDFSAYFKVRVPQSWSWCCSKRSPALLDFFIPTNLVFSLTQLFELPYQWNTPPQYGGFFMRFVHLPMTCHSRKVLDTGYLQMRIHPIVRYVAPPARRWRLCWSLPSKMFFTFKLWIFELVIYLTFYLASPSTFRYFFASCTPNNIY